MKQYFLGILLLILGNTLWAQEPTSNWRQNSGIIMPELIVGQTAEANSGFPDTGLQTQIVLNFGRKHDNNPQEWAFRLKRPTTGLSLGITHFGNLDSLGIAFSVIPYIEFNLFKLERLKALVGMGGSYFTKQFDPVTNPRNQAVTTDLTWAFRAQFYYRLLQTNNLEWRIGLGYAHHSNGHTRLLNQGYNSFLGGVAVTIHNPEYRSPLPDAKPAEFTKNTYNYLSFRYGHGFNVLALAFNDQRPVYTMAAEFGRVYNKTFKLGIGLSYRLYQHYYDYIKGNESLVQDGREFDFFKEDPWRYGTNFAITVNGEFLLNHVGIDLQLGYNLHKPGYQIDWRLNEGWDNTPREVPESWMLGEFNSKYELKQRISSRVGLKYYLFGNDSAPEHNVFVGAHLNANLGQADFTEFSIGYVYQWARSK